MIHSGLKIWKLNIHTHVRTPAKITFLDILDYSEYFDTNISIFFFYENSFFSEKAKEKNVKKTQRQRISCRNRNLLSSHSVKILWDFECFEKLKFFV